MPLPKIGPPHFFQRADLHPLPLSLLSSATARPTGGVSLRRVQDGKQSIGLHFIESDHGS